MKAKIRVGISACLLGEAVRYDGGHKLDRLLRDTLGKYVAYVPVCPEVEAGFGVPREAMHLAGKAKNPRLVTIESKADLTERMTTWARRRVRELEKQGLSGFIFKSGSPSCGMEGVKVRNRGGTIAGLGAGLFAREFMERLPLVPVEDEKRLHDAGVRENFIERIFVYRRWQEAAKTRSRRKLAEFHARHEPLILSHSPAQLRALGKIVAKAKRMTPGRLYAEYGATLMAAMKTPATREKHLNKATAPETIKYRDSLGS